MNKWYRKRTFLFNSFYLPINLIPDCFIFHFYLSVSFMLISCVLHLVLTVVRIGFFSSLLLLLQLVNVELRPHEVWATFYVCARVCLHTLYADSYQQFIYVGKKGCLPPRPPPITHLAPLKWFVFIHICNPFAYWQHIEWLKIATKYHISFFARVSSLCRVFSSNYLFNHRTYHTLIASHTFTFTFTFK